MNNNAIGQFIQLTRKEKGLTQKQLAEQINVSDKTISKWENGFSTPDTTILLDLCNVLDISVNELVSGKKISPDDYSKNAENNIISLLQENVESRKHYIFQYILGTVLCVLAIILNLGMTQSSFMWYIDLPSLVLPACICMAVVLLSGKKTKQAKIKLVRKTVLPSGFIVSLSGFITILGRLDNVEIIGANLTVCVLALLYSAIAYIVLLVVEGHMEDEG